MYFSFSFLPSHARGKFTRGKKDIRTECEPNLLYTTRRALLYYNVMTMGDRCSRTFSSGPTYQFYCNRKVSAVLFYPSSLFCADISSDMCRRVVNNLLKVSYSLVLITIYTRMRNIFNVYIKLR